MASPGTTNPPESAVLTGAPSGRGLNQQITKGKMKGVIVKSRKELYQEMRQQITALPGVTERQNAGIHEDAFFVGSTMFMHIHGHDHCDIRLAKEDKERALAEGRAGPHRWASEAGYVTSIVHDEKGLATAMELIRASHRHFATSQNAARASVGTVEPSASDISSGGV